MRKGVVPGTYAFRKDIFPVSRDEMRSIELALVWPVEHAAVNRVVVGSSPTGGAKRTGTPKGVPFLFFAESELN